MIQRRDAFNNLMNNVNFNLKVLSEQDCQIKTQKEYFFFKIMQFSFSKKGDNCSEYYKNLCK